MIRCLDIHTHHAAPQPLGVISTTIENFNPVEGQLYSIGFHPWQTVNNILADQWAKFRDLVLHPQVVAIGECGLDKVKGGLFFRQMLVLQKQIEISEKIEKPLILHDVKTHDVIVTLKKDIKPVQNWMVHGLRGKPTIAKMLTDVGIYVSYGQYFNPNSILATPEHLLLAETDESPLSIEEIISSLSASAGKDLTSIIAENTNRFLYGNKQI